MIKPRRDASLIAMPPEDKNKPSFEMIAARLAMLGGRLHRAQTLASRLEELLDNINRDFDDLRSMIGRAIASTPNATQTLDPMSVSRRLCRFPREFSPEAVSVILVRQPDGSALAKIDGRPGIPLPSFVAALMEILKADDGIANDPMVGWKSVAAIQFALKERTKQSHSESSVKELVYRLRDLLERHGENPFLVQNNRLLGYRFALRRGGENLTDRDNH